MGDTTQSESRHYLLSSTNLVILSSLIAVHDLDFIRFFQRCARGLRSGGVIILKVT
jgi:hypothetical protein